MSLLPILLGKKIKDKWILVIGFVVIIIGCLIKINYQYDKPMPIVQYYAGSIVFFSGTLIGEAAAISLLAKVISPKMKTGFFNAGLLSGSGDTLGRAIGNATFTIFSLISGKPGVPFYIYIIAAGVETLFLTFTLAYSKQLEKHTVMRVVEKNRLAIVQQPAL